MHALFAVLIVRLLFVGEHLAASDMCSIDNNPAKRAKVDATPAVDARPTNGYRPYNSIVYPAAEAFVGSPAPQFTAPGTTHHRAGGFPSGAATAGKQVLTCLCCKSVMRHAAIIDGEISEVSLRQYKGQYVILFFYPKVTLSS